jgi:hypothetical protein
MRFSERNGIVGARPLQRGEMDSRLRNGLWSLIWDLIQRLNVSVSVPYTRDSPTVARLLLTRIWTDFLGQPADTFGLHALALDELREWYFDAQWYEVYDLVDFVAEWAADSDFDATCNQVLEKERSAYRLVSGKVLELTDEGQIHAIENALKATDEFELVREHLMTALARLSDLREPDFRNSMKESISAVESLVWAMSGMPGAKFPEALRGALERKGIALHPALGKAWSAIFGYASDESGVRHGLDDESNVGLAEATYMLVTCSAIVSYLIHLASPSFT